MDSLRFYVNGVDRFSVDSSTSLTIKESLHLAPSTFVIGSVTRLVSTKRVDLGIKLVDLLVFKYGMKNVKYVIVGDGAEYVPLERMVSRLNLNEFVHFVGAIDNKSVPNYLSIFDVFLSTYDVSNVGNPLLEAIRANKIIFTLNTGDTSSWITHRENGFIYDVDDSMINRMAVDMIKVIDNSNLRDQIKKKLKVTEVERLWTWEERMEAEYVDIKQQLTSNNIV